LWQHGRLGVLVFGFAFPRVALHHSCFAILIAASPGVIRSTIPDGIFWMSEPYSLSI